MVSYISSLVFFSLTLLARAAEVKSIYIFGNITNADTTSIKAAGFNAALLFALNLKSNGDLVYPAIVSGDVETPLVTNGVYVGGSTYTTLVRGLKTGNTHINRVEVTISGPEIIKNLTATQGTGSSSALYKTVAALKNAWNLDGINNDDEILYDVPSTVSFGRMIGSLGLKYTTAPYENLDFWATVTAQINGNSQNVLDRHYLQCYDGGADNDPGQWQDELKMKVIPLLWVNNKYKPYDGSTPAQMKAKFSDWLSRYQIAGGGLWNNYDIQQTNTKFSAYADVLNSVFGL